MVLDFGFGITVSVILGLRLVGASVVLCLTNALAYCDHNFS